METDYVEIVSSFFEIGSESEAVVTSVLPHDFLRFEEKTYVDFASPFFEMCSTKELMWVSVLTAWEPQKHEEVLDVHEERN